MKRLLTGDGAAGFDAGALDELAPRAGDIRQVAPSGASGYSEGGLKRWHTVCWTWPSVDVQLAGLLVVIVAALPYGIEILSQVPLLTRVMSALPADVRAELPPHPRRPQLAVFGSARFFIALFRYAFRDDARDTGELVTLKRKMRASAVREALFGMVFIAAVVMSWRHGWRPLGTWRGD